MQTTWSKAFGKMTYGIYVLTTGDGRNKNGMIASWVSQVSHDPPLVSVAVHRNRYCHQLILDGGGFGLHLLKKGQKELIDQFKDRDPVAKFTDLQWEWGQSGNPILKDCVAWFECRIRDHLDPGNHTVFIGEVIAAGTVSDQAPLTTLDYERIYTGRT